MMFEFGEYLPDLPALNNPGITEALNLVPSDKSYKPLNSLVSFSGALDDRCQGAFSTIDDAGTAFNFAGDKSKLYELSGTTWSDVSQAGGYSTGTDELWQFAQYGQFVYATNFTDPIQVYELGVSTKFADLAGTPPQARYIDVVRNDFLVVGNTFDAVDGNVPYRVRWSGIDAPTSWTVSATTQADFQDLDAVDGWVKQVVGGTQMTVFQERSITRGTYIGSPDVFRFDKIIKDKGTQYPNGVVKFEGSIAFIADDGFYILTGTQLNPIGSGKVDRTFLSEVDITFADRVVGAVDQVRKIILWAYPDSQAIDGVPNKVLIFNYSGNATKRWTRAEITSQYIFTQRAEGYTLDGLDAVNTNLDLISPSLDSRFWAGGQLSLGSFGSDNKLYSFTGAPLDVTIDSKEAQLSPGRKTYINKIRPEVVGSSSPVITMQIGSRNTQNEPVSYTGAGAPNVTGDVPLRNNARFQRLRINISGAFDDVLGAQIVKTMPGGDR